MIDRGLQPHIADAFILNFQDESGLNPGINEKNPIVPGSRGGFGLYQLTGPRRREYEAFAAQRGVNPADVNAQLDFLMNELQGSEAGAAKSILSAPDTATAAQAIVNNFLRPAPEHRQARAARYARVATTPQEAIEQVAPIDGLPAAQVAPYDFASDPNLSVANSLVSPQSPSNFNDRWNAGAATSPILPEQAIPASANIVPEVTPMSAESAPAADPRLLALNDQMLGGALSPSGSSPVAQALSGPFPSAPSADRAPVTSQPFQMPAQSQSGGINPVIIQALSSPYISNQGRQIAGMLLGAAVAAAASSTRATAFDGAAPGHSADVRY
ncbi:putative peptidoglycan hydrolase [Brucella phage EF4]|uniref:Putative peptidoglycan hydrolase n=1 Tax=Brucella phage EF4 TaxID=2706778 RepID=A0A6C0X1D8_9CAUD|nr:putative peptidoglycan hydrolase [Brucella phage EF4]